jgi:nucleotide-binding universal stress UspA family protein
MKSATDNHRQSQVTEEPSRKSRVGRWSTPPELKFKNILVASDLTADTQRTVPYAVEIARRSGAMIHVVHVVQSDVYPMVPPSEWAKMAQLEEMFRKEKRHELDAALQMFPHKFHFPAGNIWEQIAAIIQEIQIDLLILGTHGRTGVEKVLLGSVAESIFRQASCPALTVGPGVSIKPCDSTCGEFKRILYATDFSLDSLTAAPYAVRLAIEHRAELILMHSNQSREPAQLTSAHRALRDVIPFGVDLETEPRCIVENGTPAISILEVAARNRADVIVIGVRSAQEHPIAVTHFSESTAYEVVTRANCPVLTVRGRG